MDHSSQLWSLVEQARASATEPPRRATAVSREAVTAEETRATQSLLSTSRALDDAAVSALTRATVHIAAVVVALDAATPSSTAHLQSSLLLSDAELLSVGSSLKAFKETLGKVEAVTKHQGRRRGRFFGVGAAAQDANALGGVSPRASDAQDAAAGSGVVAHLHQAVSILEQRIGAKRLKVALAKEELALYKTELHLYGHCGVLSCSDAVAAEVARCREAVCRDVASRGTVASGAEERNTADQHLRVSHSHAMASRQPPSAGKSGFGATFRVVDGMMQRAAKTVKAAGTHADSALQVALTGGHAAARQLLHASASPADEALRHGVPPTLAGAGARVADGGGGGDVKLPVLPPLRLSPDEVAQLEEQSQALLQVQREASAHDAKAVEASIRELSQLTSLMNERVVQQTEQFSVLVRNTEAAHTNVKKAVVEVEKPLHRFWNPTRQLIALLWVCMAVLLTANGILR
ncbi:hypothetical protein NESM_000110100 [Novymonas esmeraldas]|uniref:t-SNARE coiled-coil homology domain-containing protein n=1 Tax=Novymonas esmeraldas TaxID=1808958 RepID=A0AAW0F326_9TRYP